MTDTSFIEIISKYWSQILFVGGVIVAFFNIKWQNADQEKRLGSIEDRIEHQMNPLFTQIQVQLKEIDTKLAFLLKKYDEQ